VIGCLAIGGYRGSYSGTQRVRLWRRLAAPAAILLLALVNGGCSFSYQLGSLFEKSSGETAAADQTGSVATDAKAEAKTAPNPSDGDLAYARAAASEVLARGKKESSLPWENPSTGARGTVTPIAQAYDQDGFTCQDFLASYVREGKGEAWLQGEACRLHKGQWEVRSMKPWKRS
jgi:hypothetical protein